MNDAGPQIPLTEPQPRPISKARRLNLHLPPLKAVLDDGVSAERVAAGSLRTRRNIIANYLGHAWIAVMGLAFVPLYLRYLGVEAFGLIGFFAVMQACLSILDMGLTPALSREMARFTGGAHSVDSIRDLLRSLEVVCFGIAALLALSVAAASGYIATDWVRSQQLSPDSVADALGLMAVVLAARFYEALYRGSLLGLQQQVRYNAASAALAGIRHAGAATVLVWVSPTIGAFFLWQAAVSVLSVVVLARIVYHVLPAPTSRARFSRVALAGIWTFASGVTGIGVLALLLTQVDKILLSKLLPLETFGYYTFAATVAATLYMIVGPITQAVYPRMVELSVRADAAELLSVYHDSSQLVTVLTAPVASLVVLFAAGVVFTWSGDASLADSTAPILSALILGTFLNGLMWMPYQCQLAHGWTSLTLKVNSIAVILMVPAIIWVLPRFGAVGTAWIWVILNVGYVLVAIPLMHRRLIPHAKWRWYFADVALPSAGALAVALLARVFEPVAYASRAEWLGFLFLFGMAAVTASALSADRIRFRLLATLPRFDSIRDRRVGLLADRRKWK